MWKRCYGDGGNVFIANGLNNVGYCLQVLGQPDRALPLFEVVLAMNRRLLGDRDHDTIATSLNNVAFCLDEQGEAGKAARLYADALAMHRRLCGERDHPEVAKAMYNLGSSVARAGQVEAGTAHLDAALAMHRRLHGDADHPEVAKVENALGALDLDAGRVESALARHEAALGMWRRLYGDREHPHVAIALNNVARCLQHLGRTAEARAAAERACTMIERIRAARSMSVELRQSTFDDLKQGGAFERLQALCSAAGEPALALHAAERSRARELLDVLEQQRFDAFGEAERRARLRGDEAQVQRLGTVRAELEAAEFAGDRLLHELSRLGTGGDREALASRRRELVAQSDEVAMRRRQLLDERARLCADVSPAGRVRDAAAIQAALRPGEVLLVYTLSPSASFVHVVAAEGGVETLPLPRAAAAVADLLPRVLPRASRAAASDVAAPRGRDPGGSAPGDGAAADPAARLFASLVPPRLWDRLRAARRAFVAPHRALHHLPFEMLVVGQRNGRPVCWLDDGPPVAYVQSGSALCWQRERAAAGADDSTSLDLLSIGDPRATGTELEVPADGVLVLSVDDGGEGARAGLRARDVLVAYDGRPLVDDASLRDLRAATEGAIEDGRRAAAPIPLAVWRQGEALIFDVAAGPLGIRVGRGRAREAFDALLDGEAKVERVQRSSDIERLSQLPPLRGARAETAAIAAVFAAAGRTSESLVDERATESAVFERAPKAKYLHFACHGIAEEYSGRSLSMLVLSQPQRVLPEDDGLLKLDDLLGRWRGRLSSCQLVVLSACRTHVGRMHRDDAPQALPVGFLFAGAPAVVASLWAVDDESTKELMTDFYRRLLADGTDRLAAFAAAKKAVRERYPDPYHWAPFLFVGSPE
jgi:tetratricopeptide (TPR) repeat protein